MALLLGSYLPVKAQDETKAGRVSPKELTIPPSPVFDLMGVTSSQINQTSDIKDFKVDWPFKSWKLNPDLGIQSQQFFEECIYLWFVTGCYIKISACYFTIRRDIRGIR